MTSISISGKAGNISKSKAFDLILKLKNGEQLGDVDIDNLLLYFSNKPSKKANNILEWCSKSVSKNDPRTYLQYIYVENNIAYGCDGHSVQTGEIDLDDGYYCPKTFLKVDDFSQCYPKMDKILSFIDFNDENNVINKVQGLTTVMIGKKYYYECPTTKLRVLKSTVDKCINYDDSQEIICNPNTQRVFGKVKFGEYLIMPTSQ